MVLPVPSEILGDKKWREWYPGQDRAFSEIMDWLDSPSRFLCASLPTGSGKSLLAVLSGALVNRAVILTATKGLQTQYLRDFQQMSDIRGMNSYICQQDPSVYVDDGICHLGMECQYRARGCYYYDALGKAISSPLVITNYAYWMAQNDYGSGLGKFSLLVCDEAHLIPHVLQSHIDVRVSLEEISPLGISAPPSEWADVPDWAAGTRSAVEAQIERLKDSVTDLVPKGLTRTFRHLRSLSLRLQRLASASGDWVVSSNEGVWSFFPVWPEPYATSCIFLDVPKVLMMSAWIPGWLTKRMSIGASVFSSPSYFPAHRTPVFHIPTVRVNYHTSDTEMRSWVHRIDQIVDRRLDRKGILFTVSYGRRDLFLKHTRHRSLVVTHSTRDIASSVAYFRSLPAPALLVSPAIASGWDFPMDTCEYIVVGKLPYPDTGTPLSQRRSKQDKEWSSHEALGTLIQVAGRGTRSERDACEVIVIDDNWRWFWPRYRSLAPEWFVDRVRGRVITVPSPPPRITEMLQTSLLTTGQKLC